jgi:hypothetical protein
MNVDRCILIGIIVISVCLWKLIPKGKAREAWLLFLSIQMITWPAGLIPVEAGWLKYPVQLLPHANHYNKTSFSYEFLLLPTLSILFSLYFPKNGNGFMKLMYYTLFTCVLTIIEVILEKNTHLIDYQGGNGTGPPLP